MTPHEPDAAAALEAIGLGFELDADGRLGLDVDEVLALRDAAALLALAPPARPPPPATWSRLLGALPATAAPRVRRARPARLVLVTAGAGLAVAAAAIVIAVRAIGERDTWRTTARLADLTATLSAEELRAARGQLDELDARLRAADAALAPVRAPAMQVASLAGAPCASTGARGCARHARVLLDPGTRRWIAVAFELPALDDKDYQLWLVPDGGPPISAGVLARRADGVLEITGTVPPSIARFRPAISLEPRGGSPSPTEIQMVGEPL